MRCEQCGERPATVHVTRVVNGEVSSRHLCERCARDQGEFESFFDPKLGLPELFAGLLQPVRPRRAACPRCGLRYEEFARTGLLGCAECYDAFAAELEPVLRRVHGSSRHGGKAPRRGRRMDAAAELKELRRQLELAVREERYEDAARLRDRIRALEREAGR